MILKLLSLRDYIYIITKYLQLVFLTWNNSKVSFKISDLFLIQVASLDTSLAAIYSDTHVESVFVSYLELFQVTTSPFKMNTHPYYEFESSIFS